MTDSGDLNPFRELSTEQLLSKRLQIHEELGILLHEQAMLKANMPPITENEDSSFMDRYVEVDDAINVCVSSIHSLWHLFKYFDVDTKKLGLDEKVYSEPENDVVHRLKVETVSMPGEQQYDPEFSLPFSEYERRFLTDPESEELAA